MINVRAFILTASLIAALPATSRAEAPTAGPPVPKLKVAVVPALVVNLEPARVDALAQNLAESLVAILDIEATGGLDVRRNLPSEGLPEDCLEQPACVADVGKRLDVQQLLFVVMVDSGGGGGVQIDTTWVDVATNQQIARPAIDITSNSEAQTRFQASATLLLPDAPVRPKPTGNVGIDGQMGAAVPRHFTTPSYITAGAAVVGLGVGIGFGLKARGSYNECESDPTTCTADFNDRKDSIRRNALIADIGYIVAIGGAVATAVLFATSSRESYLIVAPSTDGALVGAGGRF
jgi:hypothetical protein